MSSTEMPQNSVLLVLLPKDTIPQPVPFYFAKHQMVQKLTLINFSFAAVPLTLPELNTM